MSDDKSKTYTDSARIPLPFGALIAERKPSNRLAIPFVRPLRHIAAGGAVAPSEPPKPKPPEPYAPPAGYAAVSGEWGFVLHAAGTGSACLSGGFAGGSAAVGISGVSVETVDVAHCFQTTFNGMTALEGRLKSLSEPSFAVSACAAGVQSAMDGLDGCSGASTTGSLFLTGCGGDAQAAADVTVPASVIFGISGQRNVSERANGLYVWPSHNKGKGADVYRNGSNREPRASALTHALYTDQPVLLAAGVAALSATGVHKRETVSLPVSDKYAIPMANLGEIWQISEPSGNWQGVVVGVSVEVKIENDAPVVTQNVSIDRYLDE